MERERQVDAVRTRYLKAAQDVGLEARRTLRVRHPRPLVPTGINLLGIVKHVASVEGGYLGNTFGQPLQEHLT